MTSGSGPEDEGSRIRAVDRFHRVKFANQHDFQLWTDRVLEFTTALRELLPDRPGMRPVIFVPVHYKSGEPIFAYVSPGVRALAADIADGAVVDQTPISAAELPAGLKMLFGEGVDAGEYVKRHA
jgi:hypothetical protein